MEQKKKESKSSEKTPKVVGDVLEFNVISLNVREEIEKMKLKTYNLEERKWLDVVLSIPATVKITCESDIEVVSRCEKAWKKICSEGLESVYIQLLGKAVEYNRTGKVRPIIFYGPPSGGKSTLCQVYSEFLASSYYVVDTPSLDTGSGISGYNRSYQAAAPGVIVDAMIRTKSGNPLFIFEEIDKAVNNPNYQSVQSCLLSLLDHNSNSFTDNYLSYPINTEMCKFAFTANDIDSVSEPLKSRCDLIYIPEANMDRVCSIAINHAKSELKRLKIQDEVVLKREEIVYMVKNLYNYNCKDVRKHKSLVSQMIIESLIRAIKANQNIIVSKEDVMSYIKIEKGHHKVTALGFSA